MSKQQEVDADAAATYIGESLLRWRIGVRQYKEKYGTVRVYCSLGWQSMHDVLHPGHCYIQFRRNSLLYNMEYMYRTNRALFGLINLVVLPVHRAVYRYYYSQAVRKWPHLEREILQFADFPEVLG